MDEYFRILPGFPKWLSIPIIIVGLLITAWPKILQLIRETSLWSRSYELEKKRLELLKLRYEIEAIKKASELGDIADDVVNKVDGESPAPKPATVSLMPFSKRFLFGALGAILPILISFILLDIHSTFVNVTPMVLVGYAARLMILISLSGLASAVGLKKQATPITCFLVGLSVTLLINLLMASTTMRPRDNL